MMHKLLANLRVAILSLAPALIVALPPFVWVREATYRASLTTLGRDQGIFQYIAWAVMNGDVDYRDVRDVNGPLIHWVHMVMLALGGRDEHVFRSIDLAVTGAVFALVGACMPGVERNFRATGRVAEIATRVGWALAGWVVLEGQLMNYLYWDLAQRETFCHWFILPSVALQLLATQKIAHASSRRKWTWVIALAGALSVIAWFGKPTFALFTVVQLLTLAIDRHLPIRAWKLLALFLAGGAIGALTQIAFVLHYGDLGMWLRISFSDVPAMYRFMMPRTPREILSLQWGGPPSALAFVSACAIIALIIDGQMARRALVVALYPLCGVVSVITQGKGFPYHFHPVTAGLYMQWLLIVVWLWERFSARSRGTVMRFVPIAAAAILAGRVAWLVPQSSHIASIWILDKGATAEKRASHDYLVYFRDHDFFPWEMRQAAAYLKEHTKPTDKVQLYAMDPYVLFLAERKSATPYIYAYDLNADAALAGSWWKGGLHPTDEQAARIRQIRDEHEKDMLEKLQKDPPAAFVFIDGSPLLSYGDAWVDFRVHNPDAAEWVESRYRETAAFGEDRIWLRRDLTADKL